MKKVIFVFCAVSIIALELNCVQQGKQTETIEQFYSYLNNPSTFPVSFKYKNTTYKGFQTGFEEKNREAIHETLGSGAQRDRTIIRFLHSESGVLFTVDACIYPDYDAFEWTISLKNESANQTENFSDFNAADMNFAGNNPYLKGITGDYGDWYEPYQYDLSNKSLSYGTTTGRPSHTHFPYYNLEYGEGGTLIAIGWPGNWLAVFKHENDKTNFVGGLMNFNTNLKQGESVRMPLMAFVNYKGRDLNIATNAWRRWFINCNLRHFDGKPFQTVLGASTMSQGMTTEKVLTRLDTYFKHGIKLDYYWMDAGWYTGLDGETVGWPQTGSFHINTDMFPDRLADISKKLKENNGKLMLWFEPEVVRFDKQTYLSKMPEVKEEWLMGTVFKDTWLEGQLFDWGNTECFDWIFNKVVDVIETTGLSMYRQDFNVDPAQVWAACDEPGRMGIRENRWVTGYLAFWDKLIKRYPAMMIDACASGGVIETCKREGIDIIPYREEVEEVLKN